MGAEVPFKVRVLKVYEDIVEVYAVTETEALLKAGELPEVEFND